MKKDQVLLDLNGLKALIDYGNTEQLMVKMLLNLYC